MNAIEREGKDDKAHALGVSEGARRECNELRVAVEGIEVRISGRVLLILAVGVVAALGVVVKFSCF